MYIGEYITKQGKLGHETINLIKADKGGKFYIWLNSMGVCNKDNVDGCNVLFVRSVNSQLFKILGYANECKLLPGVNISRVKNNDPKKTRYDKQKKLDVKYNGKCPMDDIFKEKDMFATFESDKVFETKNDIYLTNNKSLEDEKNGIYYANFIMKTSMRRYIESDDDAYNNLKDVLNNKKLWKLVPKNSFKTIEKPEFNFFKLIKKDRDEIVISNALAHFINETGVCEFLQKCLGFEDIKDKEFQLLREKNNMDISFYGENKVVIIENKIDAGITVDNRKTSESQIDNAIEKYFSDEKNSESVKEKIENIVNKIKDGSRVNVSQLSKYYICAIAYLLSKGIEARKIIDNHEKYIYCYLLVPKYSEKHFKTNRNGKYNSEYLLSEKYNLITYEKVYKYFKGISGYEYLKDFVSVLKSLANEFNNEIEVEMKYRFYKAIGKIKD